MMPVIFVAVGLLLIFLEFYLPGMVLGIAGAGLLIASVVLFAMQTNSPIAVMLFVMGVCTALAFLIRFTLKRIRGTSRKGTIYLESDQAGYVASTFDQSMIGKQGVVLHDLKPSGHALIEGKQLQVTSQSGYVTEGTEVVVVGGQGAILIVKPVKKEAK